MKKLSASKLRGNIFSVRHVDIDAQYIEVFSFTGADPVSFGVCACSRAG